MTVGSPFEGLSDTAFWAWLSGFSDGEACFTLRLSQGGKYQSYSPFFVIGLRADDWRLLRAIKERTGIGFLNSIPNPKTRPLANPMVSWSVARNAEQKVLLDGFRRTGGLFSKKRRDYELWAKAVDLVSVYGGGALRSTAFAELAAIKEGLHSVKKFDDDVASGWADL